MRTAWEDRANPVRMALERALELASNGIPVFPCLANKRPACVHGFKQATSSSDKVQQLWHACPGVRIGVPTGEASGLFVLDIDLVKHPEAGEWLERNKNRLPETRRHQTGSGGWHYLFQHRAGLKNSTGKIHRGVDTRGEGGYFIWWPAHIAGQHHFSITTPVPDWIADALNPSEPVMIPWTYSYTPPRSAASIANKLEGLLAKVASAPEGERNSLLYWGACRISELIATRELDGGEASRAVDALTEAARSAGLPHFEIRRTIASAMK